MAGGWAKDDAVQEQIDSNVEDALARVRSRMPKGKSLSHCEECEAEIPAARQKAIPGVRLCVACQSEQDEADKQDFSGYNRRGSKDSQLR
ncbi:phage/conjugal plasmid C-4 type zinc finger TraR family protein [Natronospira proteinivora]|uniref:Phage/conjugal plasmid C-4 type zinc finger TraR family protein n=1 Tax=Natronospira proteinivora TaxID=1807133 RepID=A0ABT1G8L6_9GAMM|nr:DksA/TraR family C4-type zinc finger protein [Natronospira proteinivora]MCP1727655.1 phage/conjugal plasmid C-4 type zinc finger TraR family protein [Natronospira proteinivora]